MYILKIFIPVDYYFQIVFADCVHVDHVLVAVVAAGFVPVANRNSDGALLVLMHLGMDPRVLVVDYAQLCDKQNI